MKAIREGHEVGWLYVGAYTFVPDRAKAQAISDGDLRSDALEEGLALTYTCAPPGSGVRLGIDRDLDGALDGDERAADTDPANPMSRP